METQRTMAPKEGIIHGNQKFPLECYIYMDPLECATDF